MDVKTGDFVEVLMKDEWGTNKPFRFCGQVTDLISDQVYEVTLSRMNSGKESTVFWIYPSEILRKF